jgi:hypothetical protein
MANDVTVLIADAIRISALRADSPIAGQVLYFTGGNLASALESIRAHEPRTIAIESQFADSAEGRAFVTRLRALSLTASEIQVLGRTNGSWATSPLSADVPLPTGLPAGLNTRRAQRFAVVNPAPAVIDGTATNLIDISVLGAQVISEPALRPQQKIKVTLVEDDAVVRLAAHIAWSVYERPKSSPTPHYRAGMEFDDAAQQKLADYCRRHCSDRPLMVRA